MALTFGTPAKRGVFGDLQYSILDVTWDNSYPTGGLAVTPANVGFNQEIIGVVAIGNSYDAQGAVVPAYDAANGKLVAYGGDGAAAGVVQLKEVANATNLSTITSSLMFLGK